MKMSKRLMLILLIVLSTIVLSSCEGLVSDETPQTSTYNSDIELKDDYAVGYNWYVIITEDCSLYTYYHDKAIDSIYDTEDNQSPDFVPYIDNNEEIYFPSKHFQSKNAFTTYGLSEKGICIGTEKKSYYYAYSKENPYVYDGKFIQQGLYGQGGSTLEISNTIGYSDLLCGAIIYFSTIFFNRESKEFYTKPETGFTLTNFSSGSVGIKSEIKASNVINGKEEVITYVANLELAHKHISNIEEVKLVQMNQNNEIIKEDILTSPLNYETESGCEYIIICEKTLGADDKVEIKRTIIDKSSKIRNFSYLLFKENGFVENHTIGITFK